MAGRRVASSWRSSATTRQSRSAPAAPARGSTAYNAAKYGVQSAIDLQLRPDAVIVTITDRGPGIPAASLAAVFMPFRRLEPSRNRHTGGMGLGLTSARAGFRAHGGDVTLSNVIGGGLRATVVLPLAPDRPQGRPPPAQQSAL